MKKMKLFLASFVAATCVSSVSFGYHYDRGFRDGMLASSASLATSEALDKQAVYLAADEDAAMYLAEGGSPTALLRDAMDTERDFLLKNKYVEANYMDSEDLAYMVMGRATQFRSKK